MVSRSVKAAALAVIAGHASRGAARQIPERGNGESETLFVTRLQHSNASTERQFRSPLGGTRNLSCYRDCVPKHKARHLGQQGEMPQF